MASISVIRDTSIARSYRTRVVSMIGRRCVIVGLGVLYVAIGVSWWPLEVSRGTPASTALILSAFLIAPGILLAYDGYRLPQTDIPSEFYPTIVRRCLGGLGVMLGVLAIYHFQPAGGMSHPFRAGFILGAFGSIAGYRVGIHDARAMELQRTKKQLSDTVDRLQTSNELLDQFAYAASHDLQEPLRMVSSHLLLLERKYGDELDDEGLEYLEFAVDRADRMREMIDGLLTYSRIETADEPRESVDLNVIVDDVRSDLQLQIEETDCDIEIGDLPRVLGVPSQLQHVFQNLLSNAITYSGDDPPHIHISADRNESEWIISVRDEGIGIHPDEQDRIFDVFERLHTHEHHEGTGMGLTLCQRIVERHDGDIWVDSTPGEGTTFSFTLPATEGRIDA